MSQPLLFQPFRLGRITLSNRVVMAPMTRNRSLGNVPGEIVATYYAQRATAGLLITEGVSPSPNGVGYPRIPGLYNAAQIAGWRAVNEAVHAKGGHIFAQLMHTGRASHVNNLNCFDTHNSLTSNAIRFSKTRETAKNFQGCNNGQHWNSCS